MSTITCSGSPILHHSDHSATTTHGCIKTSGEINEFMKMHVINLAERRLRQVGKRLYEAKIAVIGLAYKKSDPPGVASNQDHRGTGQSRDRGAGV